MYFRIRDSVEWGIDEVFFFGVVILVGILVLVVVVVLVVFRWGGERGWGCQGMGFGLG